MLPNTLKSIMMKLQLLMELEWSKDIMVLDSFLAWSQFTELNGMNNMMTLELNNHDRHFYGVKDIPMLNKEIFNSVTLFDFIKDTNSFKRRVFSTVLKVLCTGIFFKKIVLKKGDNGWR
eukprot:139016_1